MIERSVNLLLFHGAIVLMIGVLTGLFYWLVIVTNKDPEKIRNWRVAHLVLIAEGFMMLIVALILPRLNLDETGIRVLCLSLIMSGYGFVYAFITGAWKGERGLNPFPLGFNSLLFIGHFIGACGSLIGIGILIAGLYRSVYF